MLLAPLMTDETPTLVLLIIIGLFYISLVGLGIVGTISLIILYFFDKDNFLMRKKTGQ